MADIRIATRASRLALIQAGNVATALGEAHPGLDIDLVEVTTSGDRDRTSPMAALTELGAFVRAVQQAVLDGTADVAVHSGKDLPVAGPDGLMSIHPRREAPWDVLSGSTLEDLRPGATIGTGSPRRAAQLLALRPDLEVGEIRGNVETRLDKLDDGQFDAIVLAEAGLRRLGLAARIDYRFTLAEMVPAAAQAALTVEALSESDAAGLLGALDDADTRLAVTAERAVLAKSEAGCRSALGVFATVSPRGISMEGFVADEDGSRRGTACASTADDVATEMCDILKIGPGGVADRPSMSEAWSRRRGPSGPARRAQSGKEQTSSETRANLPAEPRRVGR